MAGAFRDTVFSAVMALLLVACGTHSVWAVHVVAGPVAGSITPDSARVWIQLSTSDRVKVRCFDVATGQQVSAMGTTVLGPPPFIVNAALNDLLPNHDYRISLIVNSRIVVPHCIRAGSERDMHRLK